MTKPFIVEILRNVNYVEWATVLVYADTPEEAEKLAQPLCDEANDKADFLIPFDFLMDDGCKEEWEVQPAQLADADQEECALANEELTPVINKPEG